MAFGNVLYALAPVAMLISGAVAAPQVTDSLASIKHIVLFMQENRAFDHYFGTMAGVRGFADPNVVISNDTGKPSFYSPVDASKMKVGQGPPPGVTTLLPWYWNNAGGDANDRYQCALAGSNGWPQNHAAYANGRSNQWAEQNTPYSLGYYKKNDIPFHFALAEEWMISDSYHESVIASTDPNRISWFSATMGVEQSKSNLGGPSVDNHESDGCETSSDGSTYSCYPYKWKTIPEYFEDAKITWQVYQNKDNFGDNALAHFQNFQNAKNGSALADKGMSFIGLDQFYEDAKNGNLPEVSYIVGPADLSEHPPYGPLDGAWLQEQVVNAVTTGKNWEQTALFISYDETGGWADHVMSPFAPAGTAGEYMKDPFTPSLGIQPVGPGFRLPFTVVSPWTRKGGVFTEVSSHESQNLFLEKWAAAVGKPFTTKEMTQWRRAQMSDLTKMFDFSNKDSSVPTLPQIRKASQDSNGNYNGAAVCSSKYGGNEPPIPYSNQTNNLQTEKGFKAIRGNPTEGRFLVLESAGSALSFTDTALTVSKATSDHSSASQRFVLHRLDDAPKNQLFSISTSGSNSKYIASDLSLTTDSTKAGSFKFEDLSFGKGYTIVESKSGKNVVLGASKPTLGTSSSTYKIFSVTY